jgi:hypothetical protein
MSSVNYTRTGRISKAKKGLKVHNCENCGRSYTRAEHLRRHQKNHAQDALVCEFPDCGKVFFRQDLLQRHQERHNEIGKDSRRSSLFNPSTGAEQEVHVSTSVAMPAPMTTTLPQVSPYYPRAVSPLPEPTNTPRYTSNEFRTPQIPSSTFGQFPRSSPSSKSHANGKQQPSYGRQAVTLPVTVEGLQTDFAWNNPQPFNQSPQYPSSISSGYASPIPNNDFANVFAHPPYGNGSNRTRTSSNASFIEPWGFPSRSPTSATSTMAYTWTSNDKNGTPANLAYMNATSYPLTGLHVPAGVDPMGYAPFGPKSMAQRDEEEQAFLFPEQSFGMGQLATTSFEQYLDNYWRLFHPSFPAVHRATFDGINESPMLRAVMIAIGAQYSNDPTAKRKGRVIHDRCLKLFDKRDLDVMTEPERLCDWQALFLVEVLSQYRARRAAKTLSPRFESLYQKFCQDFRVISSSITEIVSSLRQPENATYERWTQWADLSGRQRLLLCCYILEYQQAIFLARASQPSMIQYSGFDLPFPTHTSLWDATSPADWAMAAQQYAHLPEYIFQVTSDTAIGHIDHFQSLVLIAAHYNHFNSPAPYISPPNPSTIDHLLDDSPVSKHALLSARLLQTIPVRALLAVSGESWILSEKVPSPKAFSDHKTTLKNWINGLWNPTSDMQTHPAKEGLKLAIEVLQHAMMVPAQSLRLELGADMGLYFAAVVIWAVTVAANTRINAPPTPAHPMRYQSRSPLPSNSPFPTTPTHLGVNNSQPMHSANPAHPHAMGLMPTSHTSPAPPPTSNSMLQSEISTTSMNFLGNALLELDLLGMVPQWPRDVSQWQQGCSAVLRWVKMRLRNGSPEARDSVISSGPTSAGTGRGGDGLGELLDAVIAVLEKIIGRGWEGWGV